MKVEGKADFSGFVNMARRLDVVSNNKAYVGIPQERSSRPGSGEITNAELLYVQTYGSPINKIPPRPVIEPALEENEKRVKILTERAITSALNGNKEEAISNLHKVGLFAVNAVRAFIRAFPDNGLPPNKPATIRRKRAKGATDPKPLIDTGEMMKSITYVIISKEGRQVGDK